MYIHNQQQHLVELEQIFGNSNTFLVYSSSSYIMSKNKLTTYFGETKVFTFLVHFSAANNKQGYPNMN